jgi:hypothetical protein
METQLEKLQKFWSEGNFHACLRLAAGWPRLGEERDSITKAWAAYNHPELYKEMGHNPDELVEAGRQALARRYKLPLPRE